MPKRRQLGGLAAGVAAMGAGTARAQSFPNRSIRLIVPVAPGGAVPRPTTPEQMGDIMRRDAETWGRAVRSLNLPLN